MAKASLAGAQMSAIEYARCKLNIPPKKAECLNYESLKLKKNMKMLFLALSLVCFSLGSAVHAQNEVKPQEAPKSEAAKSDVANKSGTSNAPTPPAPTAGNDEYDWSREVLGPLVKLIVTFVVLGILIAGLDLKNVLSKHQWSERTILALAIVFTFCTAALMSVGDEIFRTLKDVTLVVVGFYFGAAKGAETQGRSAASETKPGEGKSGAGKTSVGKTEDGKRDGGTGSPVAN